MSNLEFWLQRGVDGFRLDAVNFCMHDQQLRDNPAKTVAEHQFPGGGVVGSPYAMQEHLYDHTHPDNLLFMEDIRRLLNRYDAVSLGEIGSERSMEVIGEYTRGNSRLHMAYSFDLMGPDGRATSRRQSLDGWCCLAMQPRRPRVASRWTDGYGVAKLFSIMELPARVCIYQGDELGLPEACRTSVCRTPSINFWPVYKGRDERRCHGGKDAPNAGFSSATPWLPAERWYFRRARC